MEQVGILVLVRELLSWRAILDIFLIAAGLFFFIPDITSTRHMENRGRDSGRHGYFFSCKFYGS